MAGVNVKIGVTGVSQFKQDISAIKQSISTMNADLALIEKQFQATGDAETYMAAATEVLKGKLEAQKSVLESAQSALDAMKKNGIDPASKAFQEMQREVLNARGDILDTQTQLDNAGKSAETLDENLKGIGKGVAWENVTSGIKEITTHLETAAKKAVSLGKKIIESAKGSTGWADDVLKEATKYGTDAETIQRMQNVADLIDVEADRILKARQKLMTGVGKGTKAVDDTLERLGIEYGGDAEETFWEIGEALMKIGDEAEQNAAANALFGQSWKDLVPLFTAGREEYERLMEDQNVLSNEQVENLGKADDAFVKMEQEIQRLKNEFWAENAGTITEMLQWVIDNKESVVTALGAIGVAFGAIKIAEFATQIGKVVNAFETLWKGAGNPLPGGMGGAGTAGGGGTAAGTAATGAGSVLAGLGGMALIGAGFAWAINQRQNNAEQVRGTEENLAARTAAVEQLLIDYINAEKAANDDSILDKTESEVDAIFSRVQETYDRLIGAEGGHDALQAYSDWRQENSYGSQYWEIPEAMSRMEDTAADMSSSADSQDQAAKDLSGAADTLREMPGQVSAAISSGLSGIRITIDGSQLVGFVNSSLGNMLLGGT